MSNPPEEPPVMDEYWQTIDGLETYAVSNYGRIVNVRTGRDVKIQEDKDGYLRAVIYRGGKRYKIYVHQLVAAAYFLNYKAGVGVDFVNGNKHDCTVTNLTLMKAVRR